MYTMHVEMSYFFSCVQSLLFFFYFFTHSGLLRKSKRKHTFTFTHSYVTDAYNPDEIILRRHFDIYLTQEHTGEWEIVSVGHLPFDVYSTAFVYACFALLRFSILRHIYQRQLSAFWIDVYHPIRTEFHDAL